MADTQVKSPVFSRAFLSETVGYVSSFQQQLFNEDNADAHHDLAYRKYLSTAVCSEACFIQSSKTDVIHAIKRHLRALDKLSRNQEPCVWEKYHQKQTAVAFEYDDVMQVQPEFIVLESERSRSWHFTHYFSRFSDCCRWCGKFTCSSCL